MPEASIERLQETLDELFMFDHADLDFGLYRIMNARREEIRQFLEEGLLPKVRDALSSMREDQLAALRKELSTAIQGARELHMDPSDVPHVRELQDRLRAEGDTTSDTAEVYGHLVQFFRRYYKEGDFIAQPRYRKGVYAFPYEGEEVKLHWANAEQYYIKTTEQFRDYTFLVSDEGDVERRVHFKLVEANTDRNSNLSPADQERRFVLAEETPVEEVDGTLVVRFEYRTAKAKGEKQAALNGEAEGIIFDHVQGKVWGAAMGQRVQGGRAGTDGRTLLRKHIDMYTAKNTFDYFIHKDLDSFLRRELDFYLKNEVLRLDDIDTGAMTATTLERQLRQVKAIRAVGLPIIEFVASLEEFQKRLWLKKKFVVDMHWCVTLNQVPPELYAEIAENDRQREEWVRLFAINEISGDMVTPGYSEPLTEAFLWAHPFLTLDTSLFDQSLEERLLSSFEDLEEATDGLLVHSDNFQALNLLEARYRGSVDCVYIDPPYNTDQASEILYKNNYKHSSWLSLIANRIVMSLGFVTPEAPYCIAIDDYELPKLLPLCHDIFPDSEVKMVVVNHHPQGSGGHNISRTHEYMIVVTSPEVDVLRLPREESAEEDKEDDVEQRPYRRSGTGRNNFRFGRPNSFFALLVDPSTMTVVGIEPPPEGVDYPLENTAEGYVRVYPIGRGGVERVWRQSYESAAVSVASGSSFYVSDKFVIYQLILRKDRSLPKSNWRNSRYNAGTHGTNLLADMLGPSAFGYPKSLYTVRDAIDACTWDVDEPIVLDYFAGSGTTAHAIIDLNRADDGNRKYILVEVGEYFDAVLKPRVLKAAYSRDWKAGKPVDPVGVSQLIQVIRLESYEDALANLALHPAQLQTELLHSHSVENRFREQYALRYWITEETRGSASLIDIREFDDPWSYMLDVGQGSAAETRPVRVDLVATFNYLLGLRVRRIQHLGAVTLVQGALPPASGRSDGENVLVIWRNTREMNAEALQAFLWNQPVNPRDMAFDVVYINGDNHLESSRRADETWQVQLIEEEFQRLMFDAAERERCQ